MFDLDGTLTRHDTLLPYLLRALGRHPARAARLWRVPLAVAAFILDRDHGRLKGRLIRAVLGGLTRAEVAALTADFLQRGFAQRLRPAALAAVARHRAAGDRLVLLSASTDLYVPAVAAQLGFDETVCTGVRWNGDRLDGALATANRRGAEKAHCVAALRAAWPGLAASAYGNAASDLPHLVAVEHPLLVNGSARARRAALQQGVPTDDWV